MLGWTRVEKKKKVSGKMGKLFSAFFSSSKSGKDNTRIKNHRPVSYGNFDGKILNKILANWNE